jgi:hypothetical protein
LRRLREARKMEFIPSAENKCCHRHFSEMQQNLNTEKRWPVISIELLEEAEQMRKN